MRLDGSIGDAATRMEVARPQGGVTEWMYWAVVSAYTDISVRASAIKNQRCCSARKAR